MRPKYCTKAAGARGLLQTVTDTESALYPSDRLLKLYYAGTAAFLMLDFGFDINVRVAFLDAWPLWRIAYYGACFGLLAAIVWRPRWAELLGVVESLITLTALILSMAVRVMVVSSDMIESGAGFVTPQQIVNFMISGGVAWLSWHRGMLALAGKSKT